MFLSPGERNRVRASAALHHKQKAQAARKMAGEGDAASPPPAAAAAAAAGGLASPQPQPQQQQQQQAEARDSPHSDAPPAKRARVSSGGRGNLLQVGAAKREAAVADGAASVAAAAPQQHCEADPAQGAHALPMHRMDSDVSLRVAASSASSPSVSASPLEGSSGSPAAPPMPPPPQLLAGGQPLPVAFPPAFDPEHVPPMPAYHSMPHAQDAAAAAPYDPFASMLPPLAVSGSLAALAQPAVFSSGRAHAPNQQHAFLQHHHQQQQRHAQRYGNGNHAAAAAAGGGARRAIRTPHAFPTAAELDEGFAPDHRPTASVYGAVKRSPSLATAAAMADDGVVDLTQESPDAEAGGSGPTDDVELLSSSYHPYPRASPDADDPYLRAWRVASRAPTEELVYSPFGVAGDSAAPCELEVDESRKVAVPLSVDQFGGLSKEQQAVVVAIMRGESVFFSGCAGTGKSHLLKLLFQFLPKQSTFFTASTGLAAVNIGGTTLHSFAGVGLGEGPADKLAFKARGSRQSRERWVSAKVLVVDEISMISGQFFDKLETVARIVRGNPAPFGGIQLVLSGDFLQLPPVKATKPTFRADTWERCIQRKIVLTRVFRQQGDPTFINLLGNLRTGQLALKEEALLKKAHYTQLPPKHGVLPTRLYPLKRDTAEENLRFLHALPSESVSVVFRCRDVGTSAPHLELLKKNCPAPEELMLKVGAQVMLLKNLDTAAGLCNGSRGIVLEFTKVHLEAGGMDHMAGSDTPDGYVPTAKGGAKGVAAQPITAGNAEEVYYLPRVQFENGLTTVIESNRFEIQVQDELKACRHQLPLTLAWALTVHKSQGMTLERAEINCGGMFENGQLYVAVSRVKSLQGLRLLGFTRDAMRTDQSVVEFYRRLTRDTEHSTQQLLQEVDRFFPGCAAQLEELRAKNEQLAKEAEQQKLSDKPAARADGTFGVAAQSANGSAVRSEAAEVAQVARMAAALQAQAGAAAAGASALGFVRASAMTSPARPKAEPKREAPVAAAAAAAASSSAYASPVKAPWLQSAAAAFASPAKAPSFRSPMRNPALAAAADASAAADAGVCCVCRSERATHVILSCMHVCLCEDCHANFGPGPPPDDSDGDAQHKAEAASDSRHRCPICQLPIAEVRKLFYSG